MTKWRDPDEIHEEMQEEIAALRVVAKAARAVERTWYARHGNWTPEEKALSQALDPIWQQVD